MSPITIALLGGLLGMFGYGISDFIAKKTIDRIGGIKTLFYAQLIGTIMMFPYLIFDRQIPEFSAQNITYVILFGIFELITYLALYNSFKVGKVSVVSPIASSYSMLAVVVSFLLFGEIFGTIKIIALALVLSGLFLTAIDLKKLRDGFQSSDLSKGVPQAFVVFFIQGFYLPIWDKFLERGGWIVWLIGVRLTLTTIIFIYYSLIKRKSLLFAGKNIFSWLILVSFFGAVAHLGSTWALDASPGTTSITVALTSAFSIVTAILAYVYLRERLVITQYIGVVMIILGLILMPLI